MEKKKALAAVMATMLIASSLTACGGTKDTENMDASQTSSAQTQAVSLDGDKTTTVKTVKMGDNDVEVEVTDIGKPVPLHSGRHIRVTLLYGSRRELMHSTKPMQILE